jgi:ABC-type branched-subunit amino acid transport system ATPase component
VIHGRAGDAGAVLRANDIALSYDGFQVLRHVSLDMEPGRITGIVGPNGAGKSSLLNVLAASVAPDSGRVCLGDWDITRLSMHRRARLGIARTFLLSR